MDEEKSDTDQIAFSLLNSLSTLTKSSRYEDDCEWDDCDNVLEYVWQTRWLKSSFIEFRNDKKGRKTPQPPAINKSTDENGKWIENELDLFEN